MNDLNPIKLKGDWIEGYALDYHIITSEFLGTNQLGHDQYRTLRTRLGQLLYEAKYIQNKTKIVKIIELIKPFIMEWGISKKIDVIIPVPPSNKIRTFQPVFELTNQLSVFLNKPTVSNVLQKASTVQSKNLNDIVKKEIVGSFLKKREFTVKVNVLLVDDLYHTGRTLNEVASLLKTDPKVNNIYVLTITKTRR